jgi:GTPase Era involved in 16S rRNA processing
MFSLTPLAANQTKVFPLDRPPVPDVPPWPSISPLDGHPLAAELKVDERLHWIQTLVAKYELNKQPETLSAFNLLRQKIVARQRETRLFLGVVGEFSSGKSTLVNALIRQNLLRTDILQGTTAAVTLISFGTQLTVHVRKSQHVIVRSANAVVSGMKTVATLFSAPKPPPTKEDLLAILHRTTSEERFAKDVVQVNVTLPAPTLSTGIVIVDTPGANATNERHGLVTANALRDLCDAALVAIPATAAGSESLLTYLRQNAGDVLHRCVFLVTKVDLLRRKRDRDLVIDNLRKRLEDHLGIESPRVLAAAPQFVMEKLRLDESASAVSPANEATEEAYTPEEINEWVQHFERMEADLAGLLVDKRLQAQADDIGRSLELLFTQLKSSLESYLNGYRQRHEALEKLVIPDVGEFIVGKCDLHIARAVETIKRLLSPLPYQMNQLNGMILQASLSHIRGASNRSQLTEAMNSRVPSEISSGQANLRRHVERTTTSMAGAVQHELQLFHADFQSHYRSLATLGGMFEARSAMVNATTGQFVHSSATVSRDIAAGLQSISSDRTGKMIGAGAVGAVVGTILLPGLGTVVGGALGGFLSTLFGPSLDELKTRCWSDLEPAVRTQLEGLHESTMRAVSHAADQLVAELRLAIHSYQPRYETLVEQMRQRDADEKSWLAKVRATIESDLSAIAVTQAELAAVREKIRNI